MLIKYYATNDDLHIIEDVTDVSVLAHAPEGIEDEENGWSEYILEDTSMFEKMFQPPKAKIIQYSKDGPCRLFVFGSAYICSDEGKTIERVVSTIKTI